MSTPQNDPLLQTETTCGLLLHELQIIWDEVGECDTERDRMLFEIEQECLEVYRRKVDQANKSRAQLRQAIADSEAELAAICSAMGERPVHIKQSDKNQGGLKSELRAVLPELEEMQKRKSKRKNQFIEVMKQIQMIKNEIYRFSSTSLVVDESDLSLRKLEELHTELLVLQKEKSERLKKVMDHLGTLNSLCSVLGMDFKHTINEVDPSLGESEETKNICNDTIQNLAAAIQRLQEVKLQRMQRLQDLTASMLELWNLMDTPIEEQQIFQNVTCKIAAKEHEITEPNMLSMEFITYVEEEVGRLEELKASKMKELVLKKKSELEEIYRKTHMVIDSDSAMNIAIEAIVSGDANAADAVLEQIELQIAQAKEEAFSRKDILDRVEKWIAACEEECWLEEYNRDENRYNAGRGTHLTLKRAEKARALVNKLPAMVEALASKTTAWESERGIQFFYDGIPLLSMLEEYTILREEKELERKRQRDQKKLQGQLMAEQETLYGSKPSPMKNQSAKKGPKVSCGTPCNRKLSLGGTMQQTCKTEVPHSTKATPNTRQAKKSERFHQLDQFNHPTDDGFAALSAAVRRGGLGIDELPSKKPSISALNGPEVDTAVMRKPFSPISSKGSSKSNATNILGDVNIKHNETMIKTPLSNHNTPFSTPVKTISTYDEHRTPAKVLPIPVPCTPSTVSTPMQTTTPAPAVVIPYDSKLVENIHVKEEMEYSFEEKRLDCYLQCTHL
ncbi:65-kDa microtubule-associated protein 3 [Capsicum annuum]|uniref:65-kDa microtubule-associated protein 3 n=1 Tax=Capsicum annuum TaxID=4072 RepID=A0A2G2YGP9_CAPAN|nr:65-kDa microtubule-associated protein 3 [Capsicum annuum]XP_047255761.1 65-kDa microtubule-associated protein 3 [Capsicum annuum]PHT68895.1 65-kDa microtubule-associated protein 3 [Capsicum annuum]